MALPRPLLSVRAARPPGELVDALRRRLREPIEDMRSKEEEEEVEVEVEATEETEETEEWDDLRIEEEVEVEAEPAEERARSE